VYAYYYLRFMELQQTGVNRLSNALNGGEGYDVIVLTATTAVMLLAAIFVPIVHKEPFKRPTS
jgi:hypothetical protein